MPHMGLVALQHVGSQFPYQGRSRVPALQGRFATTGAPEKCPESVFTGSQDQLPWPHHPHHHHPPLLCPSDSPNARVRASLPDLRSPTGPGNLTGVFLSFFFFSVPGLRRSFCRLRGRSEPSCEAALFGQKARPQPRPGAFSTRRVDSAGSGRAQGWACG